MAADPVSCGERLFLANPDLPAGFRVNAPLNRPDRATFYAGGEPGHTDCPAMPGRDTPAAVSGSARLGV